MTKLRWDKADEYVPDPGAVIEVPESTRPERWTPPQERERKAAERGKRNRELRERSERRDRELFEAGLERRIRNDEALGRPLSTWDRLFLKRREERS